MLQQRLLLKTRVTCKLHVLDCKLLFRFFRLNVLASVSAKTCRIFWRGWSRLSARV
jgi:hypothetical protein